MEITHLQHLSHRFRYSDPSSSIETSGEFFDLKCKFGQV